METTIIFIVFFGVLIALFILRKPVDTATKEWVKKREPEIKKKQEKSLKKSIETGVVTEAEIDEWEELGINAFQKSSERQDEQLKAQLKKIDEMLAGRKSK